jgi:hypothetical protein
VPFCDLCQYLLFYSGGSGVHEYSNGWSQRIRKVSDWYLWQEGTSILYLSGSLYFVPILSLPFSDWEGTFLAVYVPADFGMFISYPLLPVMEMWGKTLQIHRFLKFVHWKELLVSTKKAVRIF